VARDLRALLDAEAPEPVPMPATEEQVEALARALLARADANPAARIGNRDAALAYFRGMAQNRLAATNNPTLFAI
jgi:hypothetical protein